MLWQKEVQIDKLIGPSHSSESKLGRQSSCRLGRWRLPNASFPQNLPSPCCQAFPTHLLSLLLTQLHELQQVIETCPGAGHTKCNFELECLQPCSIIFFKDPKGLNALLLLKSLAVMEAVMGGFQLCEGDHEGSHRPGTGYKGHANSCF